MCYENKYTFTAHWDPVTDALWLYLHGNPMLLLTATDCSTYYEFLLNLVCLQWHYRPYFQKHRRPQRCDREIRWRCFHACQQAWWRAGACGARAPLSSAGVCLILTSTTRLWLTCTKKKKEKKKSHTAASGVWSTAKVKPRLWSPIFFLGGPLGAFDFQRPPLATDIIRGRASI